MFDVDLVEFCLPYFSGDFSARVVIVGLFVLFYLLLKYEFFSFQLGAGVSSIFGSIVESLARAPLFGSTATCGS